MHNIIFLDIDGVVNTRDHLERQARKGGSADSNNWSPAACQHLTLICNYFDAQVVISSTWRYDHSLSELEEICSQNNITADLLVGMTPALIQQQDADTICRGNEIARWLANNNYSNYVIIDDAPADEFLENQQPHLVRVDPREGFADKEAVRKAGAMLKKVF